MLEKTNVPVNDQNRSISNKAKRILLTPVKFMAATLIAILLITTVVLAAIIILLFSTLGKLYTLAGGKVPAIFQDRMEAMQAVMRVPQTTPDNGVN